MFSNTMRPRPLLVEGSSRTAFWSISRSFIGALALTTCLTGASQSVLAQQSVLSTGDAVVSGFSGVAPSDKPMPPGANPLDHFFIDLEGPSAKIMSLDALGNAPVGQRVVPTVERLIKAKEVGQVFAIAFDDGLGTKNPNVYFGATSEYGIHIVGPDADGNGAPDRLKKGKAGATFMEGQFGPSPDGNPGTIWRLDGTTGEITPFATLPGNSGPGVGDIVFDKRSKHFYVSDLDQGLVHRIDQNGVLVDTFDHGVDGRPAKGLDAVADDGTVMNIEDASFDSEDATTWGYTPNDRQVYGMAVHDGRLYYAVTGDHQVWSVGLSDDGSFAGDPRWELDVENLPGAGPITDMLFDKSGRMYLSQRGTVQGSYDFSEFTTPARSEVVRYTRETPDDPATPSAWSVEPESYPIGLPSPHFSSNGGIALGYGHDETGNIKTSERDAMLWTTGERLRPSTDDEGAENDVHGLQGTPEGLTGPENTPPKSVYFVDYDGYFNDHEKAGHMGDVEILQPAGGKVTKTPPEYLPPIDEPWDPIPPTVTPGYKTNLELTKTPLFDKCWNTGFSWQCDFEVRVRNTHATNTFDGEIRVKDTITDNTDFLGAAVPENGITWTCAGFIAPASFGCKENFVLGPGDSVAFTVEAHFDLATNRCFISNKAEITDPVGGSWQNTNMFDDIDFASIGIPNPDCDPVGDQTNITIEKKADADACFRDGLQDIWCRFDVTVRNDGVGLFNHQLSVLDTPTIGTDVEIHPAASWACAPNGGGQLCTHTDIPLTLFPTQEEIFSSWVKVPEDVAAANGCTVQNEARIIVPAGPHPMNTIGGADDVSNAVATIPEEICPTEVLAVEKRSCPAGFNLTDEGCKREKPEIIVPPKPGPKCRSGWEQFGSRSSIPSNWRKERRRKNGKSIWCGKERPIVRPGPECRQGWTEFPNRASIPSSWRKERRRKNGQSVWCGKERPVVLPGPQCRDGWTKFPSRSSIPSGWHKETRKRNGKIIWCGKKKEVTLYCPKGWKQFPSRSSIPSGWSKQRRAKNGKVIWCGKKKEVTLYCPKGWKQFPNRSSIPSGWRKQRRTKNGKTIWCGKFKPVPCGPGYVGFKPVCIKIKKCKSWQYGKWPNCKRKPCPKGYTGKQPNCKPGRGHGQTTIPSQSAPSKSKGEINLKKLKLPKVKLKLN